jgi:hypothetical protein
MTNYPYILFNKSPEQLRRLGARGGKAQARNRRARRQAHAQAQPAAESALRLRPPGSRLAAKAKDSAGGPTCGPDYAPTVLPYFSSSPVEREWQKPDLSVAM